MPSSPSPRVVLETVDSLASSGTPLTTTEVADEFDCTPRTVYNKLATLAEAGDLKTKKVGARGRVWWRPVDSLERNEALNKRVRYVELIADFGQQALATRDIDELMERGVNLVADTLGTDYCKILELDSDAEELLLRQGVGWGSNIVGSTTVSAHEGDSQAAYTLASEHPVVVEDLQTEPRFAGPELLTDHSVRSGISTIIGAVDGPWGILGTHATDQRKFSEHDVNFVQSTANVLATAINRHSDEQTLLRHRNRLQDRERELRESERRYRTLVNNFPSGAVVLYDRDLRYLIVGGEVFDDLGFSAADLEGETMFDRIPEEILTTIEPKYRAAFEGETSEFELEFSGQIRYFQVLPVYDEDGSILAGMAMSQDITHRKKREEQLVTLNRLNEIVQEITHLIIDSSTREEIERVVCDYLSSSESYTSAWFGRLDRSGRKVTVQIVGDDGGAPSEISISCDNGSTTSAKSVARAVQTRTVQVERDDDTDPVFERLDCGNEEEEYTGISVPVVFDEQVYGVLGAYTTREYAFSGTEQRIIGQLGEVIGHAINSLERKRALLEDRVYEITLRSETVEEAFLEKTGETPVTLSIDQTIPLSDEQIISYYTIEGIDPGNIVDTVQNFFPDAEVRVLDRTEAHSRLEVITTKETLASTLATYGGQIVEPILQNGEFKVVVQLPQKVDVRSFRDALKAIYPDIEIVSQRKATRQKSGSDIDSAELDEALTDQQRISLQLGYYAGYFNWPRDITGKELAEQLGVSPPTLHYHLRHSERKLLSEFFDTN